MWASVSCRAWARDSDLAERSNGFSLAWWQACSFTLQIPLGLCLTGLQSEAGEFDRPFALSRPKAACLAPPYPSAI